MQQLKSQGFADTEIEILSDKRIEGCDDRLCYDHGVDDSAAITDRIRAFFLGDDPQAGVLDQYYLQDSVRVDAIQALKNGYYLLRINREGYAEDPAYYESRVDYLDEDIRNRDDIDAREKCGVQEEHLRVKARPASEFYDGKDPINRRNNL